MFPFSDKIDQYIINESHHKLTKKWPKDLVHIAYKYSWSIRQTKVHNQILIMPILGPKSNLGYVLFFDSNMMILEPQINFGEYGGSSQLI